MFSLRNTAVSDVTYPRLVKLFTPIFSLEGSNKRIEEERSYRLFLNYLKEVEGTGEDTILYKPLKIRFCISGFSWQK